jgi:hypothetical protein
LGLAGCHRYIEEAANITEPYLSDSNSVGFDIQSVSAPQNSYVWIATYTAQGKTGRFRIELGASQPLDDKESKQFDIQSGHGKLVAEPGSDASILLTDLKKALEAKSLPTKVQRANTLPFTFVSFGSHQSQALGGGFNANPPGNWTPMKIFIGKRRPGRLNLNPVSRRGQFSIKDPEYGDIVGARLAEVL